jgi:Probable Zinc-ribbon domain
VRKYYPKQLLLNGDYCFAGPNCAQHPQDFHALTKADRMSAEHSKALLVPRDKDKVKKTLGRANKLLRINAATENPHLLAQWHPTKNGGFQLSDYGSTNSTQKSWWMCPTDETHIWDALIITRANMGAGCPFCAGQKFSASNSLAVCLPEIAVDLDNSKNQKTAEEITPGSSEKMWWKCAENHEEYIAPLDRKRYGCRDCNPRLRLIPPVTFERSVAGRLPPEIVAEFSVEANGITAELVSLGTDKKYIWVCSKQHAYSAKPSHRLEGNNCPYCSNRQVGYGNSLADQFPEVAALLLEEKSGFKASEVVPGSPKMAWWNCPTNKDHVHKMIVISKTGRNRTRPVVWCPKCTDLKKSLPESMLRELINSEASSLVLKSPVGISLDIKWRKNRTMAVDILAATTKGQPVVIEYDGWYFHQTDVRILRDMEKTQALLDAGYLVIRVREDKLNDLSLTHENLKQISHSISFSHSGLKEVNKAINTWISQKSSH